MNELTYTRCGDYYIPDLELSEQPEAPIGKYGRMRQRYLKEHRPGLYSSLMPVIKMYHLTAEKFEQYRNSLKIYTDCWIKMCESSCNPLSIALVVLDCTKPFLSCRLCRLAVSMPAICWV